METTWPYIRQIDDSEEEDLSTGDLKLIALGFNMYGLNNPYGTKDIFDKEKLNEVYVHSRSLDYLSMGFWLETIHTSTNNGNDDNDFVEWDIEDGGAFIAGGDIFTETMPIRGTAVYKGIGNVFAYSDVPIYRRTDDSSTYDAYEVFANTNLTADFGSGTITGRLNNFYGGQLVDKDNRRETRDDYRNIPGELILNSARIGNSHGGFFEGNITGDFNGKTYRGIYGGQFYGNGESDGKPGTVAGTLGGISNDNSLILMGIWMGDKVND